MKLHTLKIIVLLVIGIITTNRLVAQSSKKEKKRKGRSAFIEQLNVQVFSEEIYIHLATDTIYAPPTSIGESNTFDARVQQEESTIKPLQVNLQEGELAIRFEEPALVDDQYNLRTIEVMLDGKPLSVPPEMLQQESGAFHWYGLAEQYPDLVGELAVDVKVATWGTRVLPYGVHCEDGEPKPIFTSRPYWIAGGIGLVALGAGRLLRERSFEIYEEDYLKAETLSQATENFYNDANNKRKQYLVLTYIGGSIILVDAILLIIRENRHKKRVETYQNFCLKQPSVSWQPMVDFSSLGGATAQVGIKMQYTF